MLAKREVIDTLNTTEAALLLGVSEASVRRWGDGGLFPMQRLGRRGQRRFQRNDLLGFLERGNNAAASPTSEVVTVGSLPVTAGTHLAMFYASNAGRLRVAVPFLRDGITLGQPCFLIASGEILDRYTEALEQEVKTELAEARRRGLFVTLPAPGRTVEKALAFWEERVPAATSAGANVVRAVGDMTSEKKVFATLPQMFIYEQLLSVLIKRLASVIICQYDVREFDGPSVLEAIKAHPDLFEMGLQKFIG